MKEFRPRPLTLIILDGWGYREDPTANAIAAAHKPVWDELWNKYPHTLLSGSGRCVGLPPGQMGNSEVGHLSMGAGRIVNQDLTRIDLAIENGDFFKNKILLGALEKAKSTHKNVHVMGLLSPGGVHSQEKHFFALLDLAAQLNSAPLYFHPFLDGRDTPPRSALSSLAKLEQKCQETKVGRIASIIDRYYAMDRDKRWERIQKAYNLMVNGNYAFKANTATQALKLAYARNESDEFVEPTQIIPVTIQNGDVVIFMNFRSDRAREITQTFIDADFQGFERTNWPSLGEFVSLTEYDCRFKASVAFPPEPLTNILSQYLSEHHLTQLRIAETEKYAHVTFFFNGGVEKAYPLEERVLIPSPQVATYDLQPEMSAPELTAQLVQSIYSKKYDVIVCNFANPDMVGHTGNFEATVKAIETVDMCLGKIVHALKEVNGELLITADHGNAELMFDEKTQQAHTAHTTDPVPFIYIGRKAHIIKEKGTLADIAPTMLYLMNLAPPKEMTGVSLLALEQTPQNTEY